MLKSLRKIGKRAKAPTRAPVFEPSTIRARMPDITERELGILERVIDCTMTSPERIVGLIRAVDYIDAHCIEGCIVECGVWRGGSMMAAALAMTGPERAPQRDLYLCDTFAGMTKPGEIDRDHAGNEAAVLLRASEDPAAADSVWCLGHIDTVRENIRSTGYSDHLVHYVVGPVEETLEKTETGPIALLRLDTDWYESTRCELEQLFPRLVKGGVLIIDDYGHWQGCRRAVDEYLNEQGIRMFLSRMDYTGRIGIRD